MEMTPAISFFRHWDRGFCFSDESSSYVELNGSLTSELERTWKASFVVPFEGIPFSLGSLCGWLNRNRQLPKHKSQICVWEVVLCCVAKSALLRMCIMCFAT